MFKKQKDSTKVDNQFLIMNNIGDAVIRMSVLRLIDSLEPDSSLALEHYLEDRPSAENMLQHFIESYPQFEQIMQEEFELQKKRYDILTT